MEDSPIVRGRIRAIKNLSQVRKIELVVISISLNLIHGRDL